VTLDKPVALEQGEHFSVVVKLTNHNSPYALPLEASSATVSGGFFSSRTYLFHQYAESETDESYISLDGNMWYITTNKRYSYNYPEYLGLSAPLKRLRSVVLGNVCVKAFSSPADSVQIPEEPDPPVTEPAVTTEAEKPVTTEAKITTAPPAETEPPVTAVTEVTTLPVTTSVTEAAPLENDRFDINRDGKVNVKDFKCLLYYFDDILPPGYDTDLNEDGKTNIVDVILMKERLIGTQFSYDISD
jgi:hypothetical protein